MSLSIKYKRKKVYRTIGMNVFFHRKRLNMSIHKLSELCNVSGAAISKMENYDQVPSLILGIKLCRALKITVKELLHGVNLDQNRGNKSEKIIHEEEDVG